MKICERVDDTVNEMHFIIIFRRLWYPAVCCSDWLSFARNIIVGASKLCKLTRAQVQAPTARASLNIFTTSISESFVRCETGLFFSPDLREMVGPMTERQQRTVVNTDDAYARQIQHCKRMQSTRPISCQYRQNNKVKPLHYKGQPSTV